MATNLLDALPNDYSLRGLQTKEYEFLYPMFEMQIALANGDSLDQSQIDLLEEMKESEYTEVQSMAWGILEAESIYPIQDFLFPESELEPRSLRVKQPDLHEAPSLILYPNPTSDLCIIKTTIALENSKIVLIDALGKTILEQAIPKLQNEIFISVGDLAPGLYQVQLLNNNAGIVGRASLIKQ